jgi:3-deoxy-D-manno-octulosonate 8-phosphate phosphatase KdsC-like HAD superfamily phosphatase
MVLRGRGGHGALRELADLLLANKTANAAGTSSVLREGVVLR